MSATHGTQTTGQDQTCRQSHSPQPVGCREARVRTQASAGTQGPTEVGREAAQEWAAAGGGDTWLSGPSREELTQRSQ